MLLPADRPLAVRGSWLLLYPPAWVGVHILAGEALLGSSGCGWGTSHSGMARTDTTTVTGRAWVGVGAGPGLGVTGQRGLPAKDRTVLPTTPWHF